MGAGDAGTGAARFERARAFAALEEARSQLARVELELGRAPDRPEMSAPDALVAEIDALAVAVHRLREVVRPAAPSRDPGLFENLWRTFFGP